MAQTLQRYVFSVEWVDQTSASKWHFNLFCYEDETMELYDIINRKMFLKRTRLPGLVRSDIYIGKRLPVYSRTMLVVDYGDIYTRQELEPVFERTFGLIKPDGFSRVCDIIQMVLDNGFKIMKLKMVKLTLEQIEEFHLSHKGKPIMRSLVALLLSGPMVALELQAPQARCKWLELVGPEDSEVARATAPGSLRARFGQDEVCNAVHAAETIEDYQRELNLFFDSKVNTPQCGVAQSSAVYTGSALCILKPHIVYEGNWVQIIRDLLLQEFVVSAMQMVYLDRVHAAEYYQIYNGITTDFTDMVAQLSWGPCIVIAITGFGDETVNKLREACGPSIPMLAQQLYPDSIRAKYGKTLLENAVHCTDLPRDGAVDVQYFFHVLKDKFM